MEITIYTIIIWITAILIISLDTVIIIGSKNLSSRVFALLSFLTGIWVISQGFFISTTSSDVANLLIRLQYTLGITIALGFYHFSTIYPYDNKPTNKSLLISSLIILLFASLVFSTDLFISGTYNIDGTGRWAWKFGPLGKVFDGTFYLLWTVALFKIFKSYKLSSDELRKNLKIMFWALFLGIIPPAAANIFLPSFGEYRLNWVGPITSSIWILILAYSIIRYRQMNVKTIIAEVLAISMTVIFFINIFMNVSTNIFLRSFIFLIFIILVYYLIRNSFNESKQKELLRILNETLEQRVDEQTHEVKKAFELEKKAKRDLEKLNDTKDQFIMITQHNLRTPVTSIRWELESLISGTYGKIDDKMKQALIDAKSSVDHLTRIVDDFLNITALKVGSQILQISSESLKPLIEDIIRELRIDIETLHITINYSSNLEDWPKLKIDSNKIREVLLIIIENAVRYNINNGKITITNQIENDLFKMTIENTGIGIVSEDKKNLFDRLFFRSKKAQSMNPTGMGIGLSVSKAILRAHHGNIMINSEGENMGARVDIILPIDFTKDFENIANE